ncbi:MAG: beta-galactosidase [Chloroflexi bacterium]|nr:beta-galactosidase [Chloroflexota bacterium]
MAFAPISARLPRIWHGGDYNPEQWPRTTWDEDVRLMQASHFRVATVGVFSWVSLEPSENRFTFEWLDQVFEKLHAADRYVCLATPTAAQPAWMSRAYPDVLRSDPNGVRRHQGRRVNYCPNSPTYRHFASNIAQRLAERYAGHPALLTWHVSNEYGGQCFCDTCAAAFRRWLQLRYTSLDELNARWWTAFWSHTYTDWDQIEPPYANGETLTAGLSIDYKRFQSDSMLECFKLERDSIRRHSADMPITTNLMGTYPHLDYRTWASEMDVVAYDCYPWPSADPADIALLQDLNRGLKNGQPYILMEQTPSSQNWQPINALKRPGVLRLWSYLAVAHGSETVMHFQWRRGRGGSEKFHGAVVEHGRDPSARVFREVSALGEELEGLGDATLGATTPARVAVVFDWNNWWAIENAVGPVRDKRYLETVRLYYRALWRKNVPVDMVFSDSDLDQYEIVVAPMLHMVRPGLAERVQSLLERGGTFVSTVWSGVVDETDLAFEGYPGPLRPLLGIFVEEIDALYEDQRNRILMADGSGAYACSRLCEVVRPETADVIATFGDEWLSGSPAVTRNRFGRGSAYYIATDPAEEFLTAFLSRLCDEHAIRSPLEAPPGVEVAIREKDGTQLRFILNHTSETARVELPGTHRDLLRNMRVTGTLSLAPYDVRILVPIP